jgi:chromosome partitioning protein
MVAQLSDFILMPCRPARFDLKAIDSTAQIAKLARTPAAVVINAAPRGKLAEEARAAYSHAVIDGRSVHEYEPYGKAAAEIDALFAYVRQIMNV